MKNWLVILMLSASLNASAAGGDEVRNGGGLVEQFFTYSLKNLPHTIDRCLKSLTCAREPSQKALLKKIKDSYQEELKANILRFVSVPANSDFFTIDGVERLAVTGGTVGSPIYYNTRMLYRFGESVTIGLAIQSLIHELGHHHGEINHDALDLLGSELRELNDAISMELPYFILRKRSPFNMRAFTVLATGKNVVNYNDPGTIQLLFKDASFDVGYLFNPILQKCDSTEKFPTIYSSLKFLNLHWDMKPDEATSTAKFLAGNVELFCKDKYSRVHFKKFKFTLKINVSKESEQVYESSELLGEPEFIFTEKVKLFRSR